MDLSRTANRRITRSIHPFHKQAVLDHAQKSKNSYEFLGHKKSMIFHKSSISDMSTKIANIRLKNPLILSSGILDLTAPIMRRIVDNGAGAITTKAIGLEERAGHKNPSLIATEHYLMNAMGLCNPGYKHYSDEIKDFKKVNAPLIANIFAESAEGFAKLAQELEKYGADALELNLSCPNVAKDENLGQVIGKNPALVEEYTRKVRKSVHIPVIVKLTPNVNDITEIAKAAERGNADIISAINTLGPGMAINIEAAKPILANKFGGVSGPAIKPIAIASVYKIYESVKVPIIGIGGITTGKDAIEMLMAGASAVGVGSAVYYRDIDVFNKILSEMQEWMEKNGYSKIKERIGIAHE